MGETPSEDPVTRIRASFAAGRSAASDAEIASLYDELHAMADAFFRDQRPGHTLQPTALVHEAFLKLADANGDQPRTRGQFFALASAVMRHILVDHARARMAAKRGGGWERLTLSGIASGGGDHPDRIDLLALEEALQKLHALDPDDATLVELRFFGGLTSDEAAEIVGLTRHQAIHRWTAVRAWLAEELAEQDRTP